MGFRLLCYFSYLIVSQVSSADKPALHASYKVAYNVAKAGKPFAEGEFVKNCLIDVAECICPSLVSKFEEIKLSRQTVSRRVQDLASDMYSQLIDRVKDFVAFSIALDESTDITGTAQVAIFIRGVDKDLNVTADFLDLIPLHDTTTGADLLRAVEEAVDGVGANWDNLYSVTTDGAPALTGIFKGFIALLRKKLGRTEKCLPSIHCLIHQ